MVAVISCLPISFIISRALLWLHVLFILFLLLGVRPLLEKTGLYRNLNHLLVSADDKLHGKFDEKRSRKIWQKRRDEGHRKRHRRHPDLPRNW